MEPIDIADLENGTFSDDGSYTEFYRNNPKYEKLHIRRRDLYGYIRRMKAMKVEVRGATRREEWPPLTARQSRKLVESLKNEPRHPLFLACQYPEAKNLSHSFRDVFQKLQWPLQVGDGGIDGEGTGIFIHPNDAVARVLKKAIEEATPLSVNILEEREQGATHPNFLVVGQKPIF